MTHVRRRLRGPVVAALATSLLLASVPGGALARTPTSLDRFLAALARVESSGRYDARNPDSGAYGKYQIMPASWREWADRYLDDPKAKPTPSNQEAVAAGKVTSLFLRLRDWRFVAHWWLTGRTERDPKTWSKLATRYVGKVMRFYDASAPRWVDDAAAAIRYLGPWRTARYRAYAGGAAHYSVRPGAKATFAFTGRGIAWVAPVGPTRGRVRVWVDGKPAGTVNLRRADFRPGVTVFSRTWLSSGPHRVTIGVESPAGRPVALEGFRVWP